MSAQRIETEFAGRPLILETGRMARQAAGSAVVRFGDTMVLGAVTVSPNMSTLPFFPLTVEYREKTYAAGKIPGGFLKREGRPSDKEILASRLIDRSIRPLFPEGFKNEVQVFVTVLSADQENDADILGVIAASTALSLSGVPWNGPLGGVRIGRVEGNWILNPTFQQLEFSTIDLVVSGSNESIVMVEGGALELSEAEMLEALKVGQRGIRDVIKIAQQLIAKAGPAKKFEWTKPEVNQALVARVREAAESQMAQAINAKDKAGRSQGVKAVKQQVLEKLSPELAEQAREVGTELDDIEYRVMRAQVLERGERVDGRDLDTIRPISIETGVLPRTHGSAAFTRGQTQALVSVTLGTTDDEQRIDSIDVPGETTKSFMLHYNFPPYATGEVKMMRGTSRREIGHGALAERALQPLLPQYEDFPYTLRVVSEILESNGSSSGVPSGTETRACVSPRVKSTEPWLRRMKSGTMVMVRISSCARPSTRRPSRICSRSTLPLSSSKASLAALVRRSSSSLSAMPDKRADRARSLTTETASERSCLPEVASAALTSP